MDEHLQNLRRETTQTGDSDRLIRTMVRAYGPEPTFDRLWELMGFAMGDPSRDAWPAQTYVDYGYPIPHVFNYLRGYDHGITSDLLNMVVDTLSEIIELNFKHLKITEIRDSLEFRGKAQNPYITRTITLMSTLGKELKIKVRYQPITSRVSMSPDSHWRINGWASVNRTGLDQPDSAEDQWMSFDVSKRHLWRIIDSILVELVHYLT